MADDPLANPLVPVFDPENGNISDACGSYGKLCDFGGNSLPKALVCPFSWGNYLPVDVSDSGGAAQWSFITAGADDLCTGAWGNVEPPDRYPRCAALVWRTMVGQQKLV